MSTLDPKYLSVQEALQKAMNYCVYQDRCHREVEEKIEKMGMQEEAKAYIIQELIRHDFLNEERFVESFIRGKFYYKQWGKQKIKYHLKQKDVPEKLIDRNMSVINDKDYRQTIHDLMGKKLSGKNKPGLKLKQKVIRSLQSKGYEFSLIMDALQEWE
jgi:regulatory protein